MSVFHRAVVVGALLLSVQSCAHKVVVTKLEVVQPTIPADMLVCAEAPSTTGVVTDGDFDKWALGTWTAWEDCHSRLGAVKKSLGK